MNMKKLFLLNLPYLLFVYPFDKLAQAFRLAPGADLSGKLLSIGDGFTAAFSSPWLSFHPTDLLIGIAGAVILRMAVYLKDTIGSMAKSQRRFTDEHQIISFEIKGYNFKFVCELCRLLYSINCIPDQVNWNHPNIHCTSDSYYAQWNKGFKLRILLDQYAQFGAFAFRTKAETSNENRRLQREIHAAERCETRDMHFTPSTVHPAENDARLPEVIRGGHFIHFRHFCTVMGCEHAPYCKIREQFEHIGELINPFPILHKDSYTQIENIIQEDPLLFSRDYTTLNINVRNLIEQYNEDNNGKMIKEISADDLENSFRKSIRIEVTDGKALAAVLKQAGQPYKMSAPNVAEIYHRLNISQLTSALDKYHCDLLSIQEQEENLESYYVDLIGGVSHE